MLTSCKQAKVNDRGVAAVAYNVLLRPGVTFGIGASFDTQKLDQATHKVRFQRLPVHLLSFLTVSRRLAPASPSSLRPSDYPVLLFCSETFPVVMSTRTTEEFEHLYQRQRLPEFASGR